MQALKRVWTDEQQQSSTSEASATEAAGQASKAQSNVDSLAAAEASPLQSASLLGSDENVLRPTIFQRETTVPAPSRHRPELSAALGAVVKATDIIKQAEDRADRAARQSADLAFRTLAQLERAETQMQAAESAIQDLNGAAKVAAARAAEQLSAAEAQTGAAQNRIGQLEAEIATLKGLLAESKALIQDADLRVFAAETRAQEAREDILYLEAQINEQFGPPQA